MEDVRVLLVKHNRVLVYDPIKAKKLKDEGYKVTPKYEYIPDIEDEDKTEMKKELVGHMVEKY